MGRLVADMFDIDISGKYLVNSSSKADRCSVIKVCVVPSHSSVTSNTVSNIAKSTCRFTCKHSCLFNSSVSLMQFCYDVTTHVLGYQHFSFNMIPSSFPSSSRCD